MDTDQLAETDHKLGDIRSMHVTQTVFSLCDPLWLTNLHKRAASASLCMRSSCVNAHSLIQFCIPRQRTMTRRATSVGITV